MFDSLKCVKVLEKAGFTRQQAEAHVQVMTETMEARLATKQDIDDAKRDIRDVQQEIRNTKQEIRGLEGKMTNEFQLVRSEIKQSEYRQTIRIGTMISIALGIAVALLKLM